MKICSIDGCERNMVAKTYCSQHYQRMRSTGDPLKTKFHYQYKTPEYNTWLQMRARCTNPKHPEYKNYGERGIKVCERWNDVRLFLQDMGTRPDGKSIERLDVDGNYEPSNCVWASLDEQNHNRRPMSNTGVKGVTKYSNKVKPYFAQIKRSGEYFSKSFATLDEAKTYYEELSNKLYSRKVES